MKRIASMDIDETHCIDGHHFAMATRDLAVMYVVDVGALDRVDATMAAETSARDVVGAAVHACARAWVHERTKARVAHALGLTLYGCVATANAVAVAAVEEGGDGSEYAGVVTARALEPPTTRAGEAYARDVRETPARAGGDAGDVAEAVAVACDALIRRYTVAGVNAATRKRLASCVKDVVLLTDDVGAKTMPGRDDEFVRTLLEGMRAQNIRLKVGVLNETELARTHLGVGARVARGDERRDAFAALRDACEFLALDDGENESAVTGASDLLLDLQRKRVRPTAGFRGALSFGFNARVNVALYKLNAEAAPAKLNKYSEELAHRPEESHKTMIDVAFRNVNDLDGELVPVERHVKAYRYGKQHVPVDAETENRLSARFEKGMKVIGSIRASEAPAWLVTGEPSLCVPQQSSKTTGLSKERAEADARALSALARALDDAGLALLVRGAWTESTSTIHIGALTPRISDEGDFLLFTPLPFKEDYNEYALPPAPPGARIEASDPRLDSALDFVRANALGDDATMPWESLNPTLRDQRRLFEARALGEHATAIEPTALEFAVAEAPSVAFAKRFNLDAGPGPGPSERVKMPRVHAGEDARAKSPSAGGVTAPRVDDVASPSANDDPFARLEDVKSELEDDAPATTPPDVDVFDDMD